MTSMLFTDLIFLRTLTHNFQWYIKHCYHGSKYRTIRTIRIVIRTVFPTIQYRSDNWIEGAMYRCWIALIVQESQFYAVSCDSCAAAEMPKTWSWFLEARSRRRWGRCAETALRKLGVGWLVWNFRGWESEVCEWGLWKDRDVRCGW